MRAYIAMRMQGNLIVGLAIVDDSGVTIHEANYAQEGSETYNSCLPALRPRLVDIDSAVVYDARVVGRLVKPLIRRKALIMDAMIQACGPNNHQPLSQVIYEVGLPPCADDLVSEANAIRAVWQHFSKSDGLPKVSANGGENRDEGADSHVEANSWVDGPAIDDFASEFQHSTDQAQTDWAGHDPDPSDGAAVDVVDVDSGLPDIDIDLDTIMPMAGHREMEAMPEPPLQSPTPQIAGMPWDDAPIVTGPVTAPVADAEPPIAETAPLRKAVSVYDDTSEASRRTPNNSPDHSDVVTPKPNATSNVTPNVSEVADATGGDRETPRKRIAGVLGGSSDAARRSLLSLVPGTRTLAAVGVVLALGVGFLAGHGVNSPTGTPDQAQRPTAPSEPTWLSGARSGTFSGAPIPEGGQDGWAVIRTMPQPAQQPGQGAMQPSMSLPHFAPLPHVANTMERVPDAVSIDRGDKRVCNPEILFGRWLVVDKAQPHIAGYLPPAQRYATFETGCGKFTVNDMTRIVQGATVDITTEATGPGGMTMCLAYQDRAVDEVWTWTRMLSGYVVRKGGAVRIFGNPGACRAW